MLLTAQHRRRARVRAKIYGTAERPRLTVKITNRHVTAQLIDDDNGRSLAYITTARHQDVTGNLTAKAIWVGEQIAAAAIKHKAKNVVFDRAGRIYHGRLDALAAAARNKGLEF
jgi:large subunit ribosomal protein L18